MKKRLIAFITVLSLCLASVSPLYAEEAFFDAEETEETLLEGDVIFEDDEEAVFEYDEELIPDAEGEELFFEEEEDVFPETEEAFEETFEDENSAVGEAAESVQADVEELIYAEAYEVQEDQEPAGEGLPEEEPAESVEESFEVEETAGEGAVDSGSCGDNLTWTLYEIESGKYKLEITGTGEMNSYPASAEQPWAGY